MLQRAHSGQGLRCAPHLSSMVPDVSIDDPRRRTGTGCLRRTSGQPLLDSPAGVQRSVHPASHTHAGNTFLLSTAFRFPAAPVWESKSFSKSATFLPRARADAALRLGHILLRNGTVLPAEAAGEKCFSFQQTGN